MNTQQSEALPFVDQNPEVARKDLMKAHFTNAQYWAERVPKLEGDNKRAAIGGCLDNLKKMLAVCQR